MGQYLPLVTRNKDTARLIDVRYRQEYAASVNFAAFRGDLFPNKMCIRDRYLEMPEHPAMEINDWPELAMRSDYLDMRGLFPKLSLIHL